MRYLVWGKNQVGLKRLNTCHDMRNEDQIDHKRFDTHEMRKKSLSGLRRIEHLTYNKSLNRL